MPGGRPTIKERAEYFSPWEAAKRLGLTLSQFKGRVNRGLLPRPTRVVNSRWNFDEKYVEKVRSDPKYAPYIDQTVIGEMPVPEVSEDLVGASETVL